jgi:hypothetical protein
MELLYSSLCNLEEPLKKIISAATINKQVEYASFLGRKIPTKSRYIHQLTLCPKGNAKELGRARKRRRKNRTVHDASN